MENRSNSLIGCETFDDIIEEYSSRSCSCSCSDNDGLVEIDDEAIDDARTITFDAFSFGTIVKTPSTISNTHSCSSIWIISIFESILSFNKRFTGLNDGCASREEKCRKKMK